MAPMRSDCGTTKLGALKPRFTNADRPDVGQQTMSSVRLSDARFNTIRSKVSQYFLKNPGSGWPAAYDWLIFNSSTPVRETVLVSSNYWLMESCNASVGPDQGFARDYFPLVTDNSVYAASH